MGTRYLKRNWNFGGKLTDRNDICDVKSPWKTQIKQRWHILWNIVLGQPAVTSVRSVVQRFSIRMYYSTGPQPADISRVGGAKMIVGWGEMIVVLFCLTTKEAFGGFKMFLKISCAPGYGSAAPHLQTVITYSTFRYMWTQTFCLAFQHPKPIEAPGTTSVLVTILYQHYHPIWQWRADVWWCPGRLLDWTPPFQILVMSSGAWWLLLLIFPVCGVTISRHIHVAKPTFCWCILTQHAYSYSGTPDKR